MADSTGKWPIGVAFVVGVFLLAAASRHVSESPPTSELDGRRAAAYVRVLHLSAVLVAATDAETCSHGYVITGDAGFLAPFDRALEVEAEAMAELEALYVVDIERQALLAGVREAFASQRAHLSRGVALRRALGSGDATALIAGFRGRELTDSLRAAIKVVVTEEQSALARDRAVLKSAAFSGTRNLVVSAGSGLVLLALSLVALVRKRKRTASPISGAQLRPALDGIPEQVYELDGSGVVRNLHAPHWSVRTDVELGVLGRPLVELLPPIPAERVTHALRQVQETGLTQTVHYEGGAGSRRTHFEAVVVPLGPQALTVVVRDVTARVTLEDQLRQTQKMEAVGHLSSAVANEFNSMLGVIRSNAESLASTQERGAAESRELREICAATRRGATIVGQLRSVSQRGLVQRERVEVRAAVAGFLPILEGMMPDYVRIETGALEAGESSLIDAAELEQSLANLCTNARDAMPNGGTIRIECESVAVGADYSLSHPWVKPGPFVCISVSDTGEGMDEQTRERIFEPFFTTKTTDKAAGLGLSMVYGMMKDHEGMIQVYSEPGSGTVAKLYFPVAPTEAPTEAPSETPITA